MQDAPKAGLSRRQFLGGSLAIAGSSLLGVGRAWAGRTDFVNALVVGSGFGGAVAALRLGLAGIDTVVLERGRRWPIRADGDTFATFERPDGRAHWLRDRTAEGILGLPMLEQAIDRYVGVLEVHQGDGMYVGAGAGVGGGSLVYNGLMVKPRREVFSPAMPTIDFDEMEDRFYPRVRAVIGATPMPADVLATAYYTSTRVSLQQAVGAGFPTRPVDLAVDWDIVRQEIAGSRRPSAIAGQCWFGLNSGAKRSLDHNYLAQAEATGRVEIMPQHQAIAIERGSGDRYVVTVVALADDGTVVGEPRRLVCRHLFLAAGSVGTTGLLVRARATGALPALNEHVGRYWAANGDIPVTRAALPETNAGTGGPGGHFLLEDLDNPIAPTSLVEIVMPPHIAAALQFSGAPAHFAQYASLGVPPAIGTFAYEAANDQVVLRWPQADERIASFLAAAAHTAARLDAANGSVTLGLNPFVSAHPLGGAVLGRACDADGRVLRNPGLYVVDGALIPGHTGLANPAYTVAALAERCMERLLAKGDLDH